MAMSFSGYWAMVFAVLGGMLLAMGVGLLGRWLLGLPAALLAAPLRRLGAAGLLAGTGLAANRWRTAALATPIVLVAMLVGTQGVVESSNQRAHRGRHARARPRAATCVVGPTARRCPRAPPARSRGCDGVDGVTAVVPTEVHPVDAGLGRPGPVAGRRGERRAAGRDARSRRACAGRSTRSAATPSP